MKNDTKTNLKEMIELIQKQELLLPDFQRGFVSAPPRGTCRRGW